MTEKIYAYVCKECGQRVEAFTPAPYPGRKHARPESYPSLALCDSEDLEPIDE